MKSRVLGIVCALALIIGHFAAQAASAGNAGDKGEWKPLLKGDSFDGWYVVVSGKQKNEDPDQIFTVKDGVIHTFKDTPASREMPFAGLFTEKEFSQFHLRLDFQWGAKRFAPRDNSPRDAGILYHVTQPDNIWPQSVECQIQEGDVGDIYAVFSAVTTTIDPATKDAVDPASKMCSPVFMEASDGGMVVTQSAEGTEWNVARVRRSRDVEHPGWNTVDVIVDGDRAVYLINGKVVNRCTNMCRPDPNDANHTVPLTRGRILLQAEGAEVLYRNIEIKDLSDSERTLLGPKP